MIDPAEILKRAEAKQSPLNGNMQAPERVETVAPVVQVGGVGYDSDPVLMELEGKDAGPIGTASSHGVEAGAATKASSGVVARSEFDAKPNSAGSEPATSRTDISPVGIGKPAFTELAMDPEVQSADDIYAGSKEIAPVDIEGAGFSTPVASSQNVPAAESGNSADATESDTNQVSTPPPAEPAPSAPPLPPVETNEAPVLTSAPSATFAENATSVVYTATASDVNAGTTLTFSLAGADASLFTIDAATGAVSFVSAPDFERPADAGGNNVYDLTVTASDGVNQTSQAVAINLTNVNEGPVLTSGTSATFAENATGVVYTAAATDVDAGAQLTFSLGGADASLFTVNASTGAVSFLSAPNFEQPADAGGNNVYDLTVTASDGVNQTSQAVAINLTNVNEGPVLTSGTSATFAENATGVVYTASATDVDAGTQLTFSLSGADASLFTVDAATGAVSFLSAPNFEQPADAGGNNVYDLTVTASDGVNQTSQAVAINLTNVNEGPVLTSGTSATFAENATGVVYTAAATDVDAGAQLTFSLGGADASLFTVNASTGAVSFLSAPNFEQPADAGGNNVYDLTVTASDGVNQTSQAVAINLTNVNEGPVLTSGTSATFAENATGVVYTAAATDVDAGAQLTFSLGGADASLFTVNASTGAVSFLSAPNFEQPADAGGNNVYDLTVTASDGVNQTSQAVAINLTNVNEGPVLTSGTSATFAENATGVVYTASATDVDAGTQLTFSLSGVDASLFSIDAATGEVSFNTAADFEQPADAGGDNVYDLTVTASDGVNQTSRAVAINVTNVNEGPVLTSAPSATFAENASGVVYTATATDVDASTTPAYSLSGADASLFTIDAATGAVSFVSAPDFETPADAGGDNVYDLTVTASDGLNQTSQAVSVTVTNVNEGPVLTSVNSATFAENAAGVVYTATATDVDAGTTLTFSLSGADASLFTVDAATGAVSFLSAPNFEQPADAGGNNVYDLTVSASDGVNQTSQAVSVTVTNVNEGPVLTSAPSATFAENAAGVVYTASATDVDAGTQLTFSLTGADASLFTVDAATGAVSFVSAPNFEQPADAGGNNVYDLTVTANDGVNQTSQAVAINVTNVNEGPTGITLSGGTIQEDVSGGGSVGNAFASAGRVVGTLSAVDADSSDSHTFTLVGDDSGHFEIAGNQILVREGVVLDHETSSSANLTVRVTDSGGSTFDREIQVDVLDFEGFAPGTGGPDLITGSTEEDTLYGGAGNDTLLAAPDTTSAYTDFRRNDPAPVPPSASLSGATIAFATPVDSAIVTLGDSAGNTFQTVRATAYLRGVAVGSVTADVYGDNATLALNVGEGVMFDEIVVETATFDWTTGEYTYTALEKSPFTVDAVRYGDNTPTAETNTLHGGAGHDRLFGSSGTDTQHGDDGNDTLYGSAGNDILDGGAGIDTVDYAASAAPITLILSQPDSVGFDWDPNATPGVTGGYATGDTLVSIERIIGTDGDDRIYGATGGTIAELGLGDDYFDTRADSTGADTVNGGGGHDRIFGGGGNDLLSGGEGEDFILGEDGDDRISGDANADSLHGGAGNDVVVGGAGSDYLTGGLGNDTLYAGGTAAASQLQDLTEPGKVANLVKDSIVFNQPTGSAIVTLGDSVGQTFVTVRATAYFRGVAVGSVNADVYGDRAAVAVDFGAGVVFDEVRLESAVFDWSVNGYHYESLSATPFTIEAVRVGDHTPTDEYNSVDGGDGNDTIFGSQGYDWLYGGNGDDVFQASAGTDVIDGGAGFDTVDYSASAAPVTLVLSQPDAVGFDWNSKAPVTLTGGLAEGDSLSGIERIIATSGNDRIYGATGGLTAELGDGDDYYDTRQDAKGVDIVYGGNGTDLIFGGGGNDQLYGDAGGDDLFGEDGDDRLDGGAGNDMLFGGAGNDILIGGAGNDNVHGDAGDDILVARAGDSEGWDYASGGAGSDVFEWEVGAGNWWINGGKGSWTDTLDLSSAKSSIEYKSDWTVTFTSGGILSSNGDEMILQQDSAGFITIGSTGEQVTFESLEVIRWG